MPTQKIDPKVIFASDAPAIDKPPVFSDKTKGWDVSRANDGRPEIKQMNKIQQDTDLKILWLNENAVLPYDLSIDYPDGAVTLKDGSFKQLSSGSWVEFLDDFADKDAVKRGIANRYDSSLTYDSGERVVLANGDIVKSTIDGNANDPNVDMTGWVLSDLQLKNIESVADLENINTSIYKNVFATAYYENGDKRGGGYFYYDATDTTSSVDNIFVFASSSSGRWKRKLDGASINTAQAGILNDGSDQGAKIQALLDAAVNTSMKYGYTWKITIDGLEQRTWSSIPLSCNLTLLRLKDIWINSTIQDQLSISTNSVAITFFGTDAWVENKPDTWRRKSRSKALDNVTINGLSKSNTVGVLFSPHFEGNFANYVFDGLSINGFSYNLVLSSDCFLMGFDNCIFTGATERIFTYSSNIGLDATIVNMGENIRFNSCVFANSRNVLDLNYESWIYFDKCSFDYVGKSTDVEGWFKITSNVGLDFHSCHFESGNSNAQLGKYMFYTTAPNSSVNIFGGTFVFGGSLNNNDNVFYSESVLNGNFQVDGLWCFATNVAKKSWSNTKMGRFKIYTNTGVGLENVNASGLQAINKSITKDARFTKSVLLNTPYDFWFVNGLNASSTNQLVSANVASSFSVNNDGTGTSYDSLKVSPSVGEQTLYCLIKRKDGPKSNMSPVIRLSHFASREVGLFIRLLPVDVKFTRNAQGVDIPTLNDTRWTDSTLGFFVNPTVGTNKSETSVYAPSTRSYENIDSFEYFLLQINFSANASFDYIVTGLECYEVDV